MMNRRFTWFYALLIAVTSAAAALVIASRLGLSPESSAQTVAAPAMNSTPLSGPVTATTFREIAKRASPAVVNIRTESRQRTQDLSEFFGGSDLFDRFFGPSGGGGAGGGRRPEGRQRDQVVQAAGTGFIIDKSGLILTNNHVVEGASKIKVSLYGEDDDTEYDAKIVGRDPLTDSALIELTEKPDHTLPAIEFGDSSQMQPGDWVMAIGNPFNLAHTVSVGVISAKERPFTVAEGRSAQVLQTDAAINPGNSGGPLLDAGGNVVGINTAIAADSNGIGFAIPIDIARPIMEQAVAGKKLERPYMGVVYRTIDRQLATADKLPVNDGALVVQGGSGNSSSPAVVPGSPADKAGIKVGDIIAKVNGQAIDGTHPLDATLSEYSPGDTISVDLLRNGQTVTVQLTLGTRPAR
jgi:serine protease Do